MSGTILRVVVADRPPFVFVFNSSGRPYFSGMLVDLLNKILATSNGTLNYSMYISPTNTGGAFDGTKWTGVVGELVEGRADVALFPLTRTASRLSAIDCTYSYLDQGLTVMVLDSLENPGPLSVLAPFKMTLWVTLLCTVIGVALVFWVLDAYGTWIRGKQMEALRASGILPNKPSIRGRRENRSHVLTSFMAAAGAPERPGRTSWGVQVLYVVYCFFCLVVLSAYTANLTSYLSVHRANQGITGLQSLVQENSLVGVNPNGSTAAYFSSSQDTLAMQLQPNVRYCETSACVDWVRQGVVSAFVTDDSVITYISQQEPCDMIVVGDPFGPGNLVVGLQMGSPWLPHFNAAIQRFSEDGTLTSLRRAWFDGLSQCESDDTQLANSQLTIGQMLGAFVFLAMGMLVAFVTGTIENLKWCLVRAYSSSQRAATKGQSATEMEFREPSQLQPPPSGAFRRISMALLGMRKRSMNPDSHTSTYVCEHCGRERGNDGGGGLGFFKDDARTNGAQGASAGSDFDVVRPSSVNGITINGGDRSSSATAVPGQQVWDSRPLSQAPAEEGPLEPPPGADGAPVAHLPPLPPVQVYSGAGGPLGQLPGQSRLWKTNSRGGLVGNGEQQPWHMQQQPAAANAAAAAPGTPPPEHALTQRGGVGASGMLPTHISSMTGRRGARLPPFVPEPFTKQSPAETTPYTAARCVIAESEQPPGASPPLLTQHWTVSGASTGDAAAAAAAVAVSRRFRSKWSEGEAAPQPVPATQARQPAPAEPSLSPSSP